MIPGLKSIEEEITADGKTRIVFNIEDDQADEFFNFLMLEKNDSAGFEKLINNALTEYLNRS
jgi:hypothetical protein